MAQLAEVTDSTFDAEVLQADGPVLVDFWAPWCGPCRALGKALEEVAAQRGDQIKIVKVNIDEEQSLAQRYGVASIPTMILFRDGQPAASAIGAQPKAALERSLGLTAAA